MVARKVSWRSPDGALSQDRMCYYGSRHACAGTFVCLRLVDIFHGHSDCGCARSIAGVAGKKGVMEVLLVFYSKP